MTLHFYLRLHTKHGQSLWLTGDTDELGNNDPAKAFPLTYMNDEFWEGFLEIKKKELHKCITYKYIVKNESNELLYEWGKDRQIDEFKKDLEEIQLVDTWNHAGEYENAFYSAAFKKVLLKRPHSKNKGLSVKNFTHLFKVKAPLLKKNEVVCLTGNCERMNDWSERRPVLLVKEGDWWKASLVLSDSAFSVAYK